MDRRSMIHPRRPTRLARVRVWLAVAGAAGGMVLVGGAASASTPPKLTTLRYFATQTSSSFTTPTGAPVGSRAPGAGDEVFNTSNLYAGTARHHARNWTATASLHCTIVNVTSNAGSASCEAVLAIGSSTLVSLAKQTFGQGDQPLRFPITGGTGRYLRAKGLINDQPLRNNNDELTITIR
jgi:hypothetical protein